ncbi:uncharacterized protein K02A2.6-like [Aedes albopictus]|uniref:RNA-directed DNA polymerase n=1 Tax=Aedes albopictus TaxID=7160 RepID=A0ABM1XT57_AEDAL
MMAVVVDGSECSNIGLVTDVPETKVYRGSFPKNTASSKCAPQDISDDIEMSEAMGATKHPIIEPVDVEPGTRTISVLNRPLPEHPSSMASALDEATDGSIIVAVVAGLRCPFLIDSGAQVNTFTEDSFCKLMSDPAYSSEVFEVKCGTDRPLKAYASSGNIEVMATFNAYLFISDDRPILLEKFYVVKEARALLSRTTASRYSVLMLGLKVPVQTVQTQPVAAHHVYAGEIAVLDTDDIFPKFNVPPVKIHYDKSKPPCRNIFLNIPAAVKPLVEKRIQELIKANIIEPVIDGMDTSFCSSMLVVPKGKEDIRLVIDLRGPNRYIYRTPFSMPTLEQILAEIDGATWFSTIDISNAYFHIELDEESRHLTNFFTEFGMFRCVRLPFGLCNAPDLFQETLQRKILGGCKGCKNYQDDVLVFGATKEEHDRNLEAVLACLANHNVKLNEEKCVFGSQIVGFLGFTLTPQGWMIEEEKISAINNFRTPVSCSEVKSFLGLITFVDKFIIHRATKTEHLRALATSERFYWTEKEEAEFSYLKNEAFKTIKRLGYYNPSDRIELFVDASPTGLGAVLVQYNASEQPRIIACASKVLTATEQRYPQTQKEALAVVWGVERFNYYLLTTSFVIRTDAEANQYIFNTNHRLGRRAVTRAEGWALRLQPYDFTVQRVAGVENVADALSRLIPETQQTEPFEDDEEKHFLYALDPGCMELTWTEIESRSEGDEELQLVRKALETNKWPQDIRAYEAQKKKMHCLGFLVFKDERTILPHSLRRKALESAHGGHIGEVAMKRIMRQFFWWPKMSVEVSRFVRNCETCTLLSRRNPPLPLASRDLPDGPWEILQIDFLSVPNFGTGEFLVVVDTYSRYLHVVEMKSLDAESTNSALCEVFHTWGYPVIIQSDNGPPFQSTAFNEYWKGKGIEIRKAVPLSPQSNGAVERQNQGIIKAMSASRIDGRNWRNALQEYVHRHNTLVPHSRLAVTPFELMVGWKHRGTFPSLWGGASNEELDREEVRDRDAETKLSSKMYADSVRGARESNIKIGDVVLLAQQKRNKTDPTFSSERYRVVAREGAKVVVISKAGVQYARNVQEVKRAPDFAIDTGEASDDHAEDDTVPSFANSGNISENDGASSSQQEIIPRALRSRQQIKRPSRFDHNFVYRVFH